MNKILITAVILCFTFCLAFSGQMREEKKKAGEIETAYPETSNDYRGVVALRASFSNMDDLVCDFGSNGLWYYGDGWTKLNVSDPEFILGFQYNGTEYVLCDFGSLGLWYWTYASGLPGQFVKISASDANNAFVTDDDGDGSDEIHLFFGTYGLWRYDMGDTTKLTKLHTTEPVFSGSLRSDLWTSGHEEGAHSFSGSGFWTYNGVWTKINYNCPDYDNVSADVESSNANEELICDYNLDGLWLYDGTSWHRLSYNDVHDLKPVRFEGTPDYELLVTFDSPPGLWVWEYTGYPGSWTQISANTPDIDEGFCEAFDPNGNSEGNGDQEVAVDFDTNGLWLYDQTFNSWTKINSSNPSFMIRCDFWGDGYDTSLVVDFGPSLGLWIYDGRIGVWVRISFSSPEGISD